MRRQLTTVDVEEVYGASSKDIFPLPVSQEKPSHFSAVRAALNDLYGHGPFEVENEASDLQVSVKKDLDRVIGRFHVWEMEIPQISFKEVFKTKDVSYTGEEIKVAQALNWKAVEASLPAGVGMLPLQEFCRHGTLDYVLDFEKYLLPKDAISVPRPPKVQVVSESWDELCKGLVERNICEVWPIESLFHHGGEPLLNGLFAVGKGEYVGNVETQRLIMNLTPVNSRHSAGYCGFLRVYFGRRRSCIV